MSNNYEEKVSYINNIKSSENYKIGTANKPKSGITKDTVDLYDLVDKGQSREIKKSNGTKEDFEQLARTVNSNKKGIDKDTVDLYELVDDGESFEIEKVNGAHRDDLLAALQKSNGNNIETNKNAYEEVPVNSNYESMDYNKVENIISNFNATITKIENIFNRVNNNFKKIDSTDIWTSDLQESIIRKYAELSNHYDDISTSLKTLSNLFNTSLNNYKSLENSLKKDMQDNQNNLDVNS